VEYKDPEFLESAMPTIQGGQPMGRIIIAGVFAVVLAGCASIPPETVARFARFNSLVRAYVPGKTTMGDLNRDWERADQHGYGQIDSVGYRNKSGETVTVYISHSKGGFEEKDWALRFEDHILQSLTAHPY
jgi:hypothetical protein